MTQPQCGIWDSANDSKGASKLEKHQKHAHRYLLPSGIQLWTGHKQDTPGSHALLFNTVQNMGHSNTASASSLRGATIHGLLPEWASVLTSTMTLFPPIIIGVMNTQKMSYRKHSGNSMQATCIRINSPDQLAAIPEPYTTYSHCRPESMEWYKAVERRKELIDD